MTPERRPPGRDRPGRARLPVGRAQLRDRRSTRRAKQVDQPGGGSPRSRSRRTARTASPAGSRYSTQAATRSSGGTRARRSSTTALCRCGQSQNKPFCSGMHWYVELPRPRAGTPTACPPPVRVGRRLPRPCCDDPDLLRQATSPQDPLLSPLFADMSPDHPERSRRQWLGGSSGGARRATASGTAPTRTGCSASTSARRSHEEQCRARWVAADHAVRPRTRRLARRPPSSARPSSSYIEWEPRLSSNS